MCMPPLAPACTGVGRLLNRIVGSANEAVPAPMKGSGTMNDGKNGAPFARTPELKQRRLRYAIACTFAAAALVAGSATQARIVSVTMSAPTVAFGGFSWPGVGQYVK